MNRSFLTLLAVLFALALGFYAGVWYAVPHSDAQELEAAIRVIRVLYGCGLSHPDYEFWWKARDDRVCFTTTQVNQQPQVSIIRLRPTAHVAIDGN